MRAFSDQDIFDYLLGRLDEETHHQIDQQRLIDQDLEKRIHMEQLIIKGVEDYGRQAFKARIKHNLNTRRKNRTFKWLIGGLILLGLLAFMYFFLSRQAQIPTTTPQSAPELYAQYYQKPALLSTLRSEGPTTNINEWRSLYASKDYTSLSALDKNNLPVANQSEAVVMQVVALMELGDYKQAITLELPESADPRFSDHYIWYKALALLQLEQTRQALVLLQTLANDTQADHHEEATALINQLK